MRNPRTFLLLTACACASAAFASSRLSALPPRPGMRLAPSVTLEWGGGAITAVRYVHGAPASRQELAKLRARPGRAADSWSVTFDPAGSATVEAVGQGRLLARSVAEPVGPFLGRMPAAIEVESPSGTAQFNGQLLPVSDGSSGRLYLVGGAEAFTVSGGFTGPELVRVTLYSLEGDRASPVALLPAAGLIALGELDEPDSTPVPEPSAALAFGGFAWFTARKVSGRRARRAGRPRPAGAGRTGRR